MGDTTLDRLRAFVAAYDGAPDDVPVNDDEPTRLTLADLRALLALAEAAAGYVARYRAPYSTRGYADALRALVTTADRTTTPDAPGTAGVG